MAEALRVPSGAEIERALREQAGMPPGEGALGFTYRREGDTLIVNATGDAWGVYNVGLVEGDVPPGEGIVFAVRTSEQPVPLGRR